MKIGRCQFEAGHAKMDAGASISDFQGALEFAVFATKGGPWWVGDLLNEAERRFGDLYAQACPMSLSNSQSNRLRATARRIKRSHRRPHEGLSQSHYDTAARLPEVEQEEFLQIAIDEGLNSNEFRDLVADQKRAMKAAAEERVKDV